MSTPGFSGFSTPRRRPTTPGRRDHILPSFNSPASAKLSRLLESTPLEELPQEALPTDYDPPRVWFQRDEDKRQNSEFTRRVDEMVTELKRLLRERRLEHEHQVQEALERETRMARDMESLETEHRGVLDALKDELGAEDELSRMVGKLQVTEKSSREAVARLVKRKEELEVVLAGKQRVVDERREVIRVQREKNVPELKFFEERMGLTVVGGGTPSLLSFVFTLISLSDPQRPFTITLDLSQREYQATHCSPRLDGLSAHMEWLNTTRDFHGFLKRIRHDFSTLYNETI
ncbi:kinetochore-associated Ndc80 complex subunit spc25 [Coemansia sp. S100]|nr:kinetochore-associated Ndc80 complex subunit spc25 [Coemansia sp. S100]KAJ2108856.1 kinetochore-associated Ndc80 complex subunit spc25 [Coemansia sp. S142-1]